MRVLLARPWMLLASAIAVTGCTAVLGDFSVSGAGDDGGVEDAGPEPTDGNRADGARDAGNDADAGSHPGDDGGTDAAEDTGVDTGVDAGPPDVGPPGTPGVALTAGGTISKSAHFKVIGALGESPGGNVTAQSQSYKLQSGVIGATQ